MSFRPKRTIFVLFAGVAIIISVIIYGQVFSYDTEVAHPFLTEKVIELFNKNSEIQISQQQREWLKQGAIEEDTPIRWMNHFYNPITGNGLWGFSSAKDWSRENIKQLFYPKGNQTWQKAIEFYTNGDKKQAFIALGHVLHLIEDMSVPAHTRDDAHPEGDPYESWVKNNAEKNFEGVSITNFDNLDNFFDLLAGYSNKYFLSKDTINKNELANKNIFRKKIGENKFVDCIQGEDSLDNKFCLVFTEGSYFTRFYFIDDPIVHSDYYSLLAPKAISYGAGVIDLFFKEVEKEEQKQQEKSWLDKLKEKIGITQPASPIVSFAPETSPPAPLLEGEGSENSSLTQESELQQENQDVRHSVANNPETIASVGLPMSNTVISQPSQPTTVVGFSLPYPGFGGGAPPSPVSPAPTEPAPDVNEPEPQPEFELSPPSPPTDTTPPDVLLTIPECSNSLSGSGCLLATTTLNIIWSSSADDLDYFEFNNGSTGSPQVSTTTATSTIVAISDNSTNNFSVRAKDKTGNWSEPQSQTVEISSMPVVINEVAWAGTSASTYDEWIELYNRTNYPINLSNWVLRAEDGVPYINLSGTIPAKGYYLLERTATNTVSDILDDQIYTGALNNSGEVLLLSYASTTIDQTTLNTGRTFWPGGTVGDSGSRTMERYDTSTSGNDPNNWGTNNMLIKNGKDANGNPINGTPKARNSVNYLIANGATTISLDITLTKEKSPYLVNTQTQIFQVSSTLTIESGVVIKFYNGAGMRFFDNAKIISQGTASDPIIFTSFNDDGHGGGIPGSWHGMEIKTNNQDSIFDHVVFRYGGELYIQDTSATISNSTFEYSKVYGLNLFNSNSTVSNNIFQYNTNTPGGDPAGYLSALLVIGGSPTVQNNKFYKNQRGIYLGASSALIDSNIFEENAREAIYSFGPLSTFTNNSGSGNIINAITINGNLTQLNSTSTLKANSLPYYLWGYETPTVVASSTLVIEPGALVKSSKIQYTGKLRVYGNLIIQGMMPRDVIFSSLADDNKGSWEGITLYPGSYSEIKGATFSNADIGLKYIDSPINLSNVKFINNTTALSALGDCPFNVDTTTIEFIDNTSTTSPPGLW